MAIGANLIAIVSLVGVPRLPIRLAVWDAAAMGLSVFVGAATGPYPWLHTLVLVPWCFGAGMLVVFGQTQATVGTQSLIAYLVLGRYSGSPDESFHLCLLVVAGALVEVVALVILRLPPSLRHQRNRLADAFEAVAKLSGRDPLTSAIDVMKTLDDAEHILSAPSLFGRTDVRDLRAVLDQARRTASRAHHGSRTEGALSHRERVSTDGNRRQSQGSGGRAGRYRHCSASSAPADYLAISRGGLRCDAGIPRGGVGADPIGQ